MKNIKMWEYYLSIQFWIKSDDVGELFYEGFITSYLFEV